MKPTASYTIWFSQRTGSTLLSKALEQTGCAGKPSEWLNINPGESLLGHYNAKSPAELQQQLWASGSTPNGVFGLKFSFHQPFFSQVIETFSQFPGLPGQAATPAAVWENAFPNHRHIFMTRRNKVRLAVSWWKAIQTQEWHRATGASPQSDALADQYSFDAIRHLFCESSLREAGIQEFFSSSGIIPLTIVYEDFIQAYAPTVCRVLKFLEVDMPDVSIQPPYFEQLADDVSEEWAQRFRRDLQKGWSNIGW